MVSSTLGFGALDANARARLILEQVARDVGLHEPRDAADLELSSNLRKRAFRDPRAASELATVALVEEDDALSWHYEPPPRVAPRRFRALARANDPNVVHQFQFLEVPPNQIGAKLEALDLKLTPYRGLRIWQGGTLQPFAKPPTPLGRVLLLVHGTFSRGEMYFEELAENPQFVGFSALTAKYDAVLTFDHPTLSRNPWLNALELTQMADGVAASIDVICHSRGGLVVAWWLLHARPPVKSVVFVGSPLGGTSLAAPAQLKRALDLLGNYAKALGMVANSAATVVPMMTIAAGLMKIFGALLWVGARTPLLDAGVSLVPGLASQSLVSNNHELRLLFSQDWMRRYQLAAVHSNYEPLAGGVIDPWWKFWTRFRNGKERLLDWGADAIFPAENDLVVDVGSMRQLGPDAVVPQERCLDLSQLRTVHHCAYFRQAQTVDFLRDLLG